MPLSKSHRMQILLAVSVIFFVIELVAGIAVHSLALVADSFHMLNDVLSLCVGLWAVKVAKSRPRTKNFTYGWQTAETLGALINGVFLVALCFSIMLEAIQRFFDPPEISHPQWILGIGSAGLAMNIMGLFLFHDHSGHAHGSAGKSHRHGNATNSLREVEEGFSNASTVADERGNIEDVLPQNRIRFQTKLPARDPVDIASSDTFSGAGQRSQMSVSMPVNASWPRKHRKSSRSGQSRTFSSVEAIATHPASLRNDIIALSRRANNSSETDVDSGNESSSLAVPLANDSDRSEETTPLLSPIDTTRSAAGTKTKPRHSHAKDSHGAHSHGDLNMRGVFLHVLGDALGNVGVIATALFIWLTPFSWRFYSDPVISLVIAIIILTSAFPLCRAASRILLLAVPTGINVDDIKRDVLSLNGVVGCHHVHVWQLSDTTMVASMHVRVSFDPSEGGDEGGGKEYMDLARQIRHCLHAYNIHSTTIQPEFCLGDAANGSGNRRFHTEPSTEDESCREEDTSSDSLISAERLGKLGASSSCLLDCGEECGDGGRCCRSNSGTVRLRK